MAFLLENTTLSPIDLNINTEAFKWHTRMAEVFIESADMVTQRTQQYQDALAHKKERFLEEQQAEEAAARAGLAAKKEQCALWEANYQSTKASR